MKFFENEEFKKVRSEKYNYDFNKKTGFFARWGKTLEEDPVFAPMPEILDLEISEGPCSGGGDNNGKYSPCEFCYKQNGYGKLKNMSFETFKDIFNKINKHKTLTQIAFGITDIYTNPDFFKMMEYSRNNGVIPNYTTSGFDLDEESVRKTKELCGAVAVSIHNKEKAFNAIKSFTDFGMTQVNVHWVLMEENIQETFNIIDELTTDERTKKLNALVLLAYKPKGRNKDKFHSVKNSTVYNKLMKHAKQKELNIGFDSCSAPNVFLGSNKEDYENINLIGDACESTLYSSYINVDGDFFPCSFTEGEKDWEKGISVIKASTFDEVWYNKRTIEFRNKLLNMQNKCDCFFSKSCRHCPTFEVTNCHKTVDI